MEITLDNLTESIEVTDNLMNTVWCTKYCTTGPITQHEVIEIEGNVALVKFKGSLNDKMTLHGENWHRTKESAGERAHQMIHRKLRSLQKQIRKLEEIDDADWNFQGLSE